MEGPSRLSVASPAAVEATNHDHTLIHIEEFSHSPPPNLRKYDAHEERIFMRTFSSRIGKALKRKRGGSMASEDEDGDDEMKTTTTLMKTTTMAKMTVATTIHDDGQS